MRRLAVLALAAAACATPPLERPRFGPTDAGAIRVPLDRETTLTGTLTLPATARPAPAVVLMHGCSGVSRTHHGWASTLRDWGTRRSSSIPSPRAACAPSARPEA